jgi:hypothetical protein
MFDLCIVNSYNNSNYWEATMVNRYADLSEQQMKNTQFILDKAQGNEISKMKIAYNVTGRSLEDSRNNILDLLSFEMIPFSFFYDWLTNVYLEGNNTLFIYKPEDENVFEEYSMDKLYKKHKKEVIPVYDLNVENINNINLINVNSDTENNQLIFTFAAPAQLQLKSKETGLSELKKDIYIAYVIMDYNLKHFVLIMHPTVNLSSIMGETKKREWDDLTYILMTHFKNNILSFDSADPEWIVDALFKITEEYFHHNNPLIDEKLSDIKDKWFDQIIGLIHDSESSFKRSDCTLRIEKSLESMIESELVVLYRPIRKEVAFEVFLQQSDKGVTQYRANSRGKALGHAESSDIVKLMWENGDIVSLGIIHNLLDNNGIKKDYPYIVSKSKHFYSLKKYNISVTEKEVVDDVLRKLNRYKQKVWPSSGIIEESGHGADDTEA